MLVSLFGNLNMKSKKIKSYQKRLFKILSNKPLKNGSDISLEVVKCKSVDELLIILEKMQYYNKKIP